MMWCIIPAAGRGTRLDPSTREGPKALLDIGGRPLIELLLERLSPAVSHACIVVGTTQSRIRGVLGDVWQGIHLRYVVQLEPLGVADAVFRARGLVSGPFVVAMGDSYYDEPLAPYIESWRRSGTRGSVLVEPIHDPPRDSIGLVQLQGDRVRSIAKTTFADGAGHRVCGMVILPEVAFQTNFELAPGDNEELELEDEVMRLISLGVDFQAIVYQGWRRNINTDADLKQVRMRVASAKPAQDRREEHST